MFHSSLIVSKQKKVNNCNWNYTKTHLFKLINEILNCYLFQSHVINLYCELQRSSLFLKIFISNVQIWAFTLAECWSIAVNLCLESLSLLLQSLWLWTWHTLHSHNGVADWQCKLQRISSLHAKPQSETDCILI